MEPEGSLSCSQVLANRIYPEADVFSPYIHISPRSISILSSHLCQVFQNGDFFSRFPTKFLNEFLSFHMHATCLANLTIELITLIMLGEEYKL
jgi:hypothetical protein